MLIYSDSDSDRQEGEGRYEGKSAFCLSGGQWQDLRKTLLRKGKLKAVNTWRIFFQ
jgi:hypothetical protein